MAGINGTVEIGQSDQELVYSKKKIRNIRIILSILSVIIIGGLITVAVILLVNSSSEDLQDNITKDRLTLDDILTGKFSTRRKNITWCSCDEVLYRDGNKVLEFNVVEKTKRTLMDVNRNSESILHEKSADGKYLLFAQNYYRIFRHSFSATYSVLHLETKQITPITIKGNHERLVLAKWSPVGNALILNLQGNLYYKPSIVEQEIQITSDVDQKILNGIPDWVYEEEVFSTNEAVWFNPSGTYIAYVRFDDNPTQLMTIPFYGEPGNIRFQYPANKPVPYPKSGSPNPLVTLRQVNLAEVVRDNIDTAIAPVPVPSALNTEEHIITSVDWLNDDTLYSVWMNRVQNEAHIQVFTQKKRYEIYNLKSKSGWVDLFTAPSINKDGSQIALILPSNQGESDEDYKHLMLLATKENPGKPEPLTSGKYVIQSIVKWDYDTNLIFYMANTPEKSQVLHLFAIKAKKGEKPQCITCNLIKFDDVEQTYFGVEFSECGKNLIINSLGPSPPSVHIFQWSYSGGNVNLKKLIDWETNDKVRNLVQNVALPTTEIKSFDIGNGFSAKVILQLPVNLDTSGDKKYPMLVDVYGGPDSYAVTDKWGVDWGTYLASNRSIIYAKIDGRGSGMRGDKLLHSVYKQLGTVEVHDQINITRKLQENLPYIDAEHTGIWGWSYGGYAAGLALALDNKKVFQCATSVAPVTDWTYYDSIYTERFMQTPEKNPTGYQQSRLVSEAANLKDKKYLIVHGTFDDNVHYQQAMMLIKALERENILFKQISYPDEDHSLGNVRPHLYHSLDRFFGACFGLETNKFFR